MTLHLPAETAMALALAMTDPRCGLDLKREAASSAIEDLIAFLDDTDGDCDLEPDGTELDCSSSLNWAQDRGEDNDDEPSLGWGPGGPTRHDCGGIGHLYGVDAEADRSDDEPSLGSPEVRMDAVWPMGWLEGRSGCVMRSGSGSQTHWGKGRGDDDEAVNEDGGDVLDEPHDFDHEDDESTGDDEPLMGWSDRLNQSHLDGGDSAEERQSSSGGYIATRAARSEALQLLRGIGAGSELSCPDGRPAVEARLVPVRFSGHAGALRVVMK